MTNKDVTIWVYDDEGVSELSVESILATVKGKLPASIITSVQTISSQDIINNKLNSKSKNIGILMMPGGADLPYCKKLNGLGNDIIRKFISEGNIYIGICAGGYYGAREIKFTGQHYNSYEDNRKKDYEINGPRELCFFSGTAIGSIKEFTNGQLYDEGVASKAIVTLHYANGRQDKVYYHGGAYFLADKDANFNILATYSNGRIAVVSGDFGQGKYLLSGVHFELCPSIYEKCVINQASKADIEKEQLLLSAISHEDYGMLIYQEIAGMIEQVYSRK